jgi:flavin reductase (DIM6/NTAB) family NADH-FMN oxidoreductase RutF
MPTLTGETCQPISESNCGHSLLDATINTGEFSVNLPSSDMVEITDYTGLVSGKRTDKSDLFEVYYGEMKSAPLIKSCPLSIECKVSQTVDLPTNSFFIAEIINIYTEDIYLTDGKPDIEKMKPFLLTMPDNRFWSIGECVGNAWNAGKKIKETKN